MDLTDLRESGTQHKAHINIKIDITRSDWLESFNPMHPTELNSLHQRNCGREIVTLTMIINTLAWHIGSIKRSD